MTPETAPQVLYNDIVPREVVERDHRELVSVLSAECEVVELADLLADACVTRAARERILGLVLAETASAAVADELCSLEPPAFVRALIEGVPKRADRLEAYLSPRAYDVAPLPNLYFSRDAGFVVGSALSTGAMAFGVRNAEAVLVGEALRAAGYAAEGLLFDGPASAGASRIEGGDVIVISEDVLVCGVSERTSPAALDMLCDRLAAVREAPLSMLAVELPQARHAIHLDMVFTLVNQDAALVYEPLILSRNRAPVYRIELSPDGSRRIHHEEGLLPALAALSIDLKPILCGGRDPVHQQREQWLSGCNAFALAPGRVLSYDCNPRTLEELVAAGMDIITIPGAELARGGGGPRCMTMPLLRDDP
jgi:arginine deiminase